MSATVIERQRRRDEQLAHWSDAHRVDVKHLDEGQKWIVFVTLELMTIISALGPLRRVLGYLLAHSGMGLGSTLIGTLLGVSDRAIRYTQALTAKELMASIRHPVRGHRAAKLGPEHAGRLAKYLVEHPKAKVHDILDFISKELGVTMDRLTLRRYIARYGLGCLRKDAHEAPPLLSAQPPTAAHFF
jgi:hypothetical protein